TIKRTSTEDICMAMSNIQTSSEDISLNFALELVNFLRSAYFRMKMLIPCGLVEYEEFQNRKVECQNQKILELENNVKSLTNQHVKLESNINLFTQRYDQVLEEISKLKERMHYENEVLQAEKNS
ncbi:14860_t:CDS:1, partial [Gigaspora rosea]